MANLMGKTRIKRMFINGCWHFSPVVPLKKACNNGRSVVCSKGWVFGVNDIDTY